MSVLKLFGSEASQMVSEYALVAAGPDGLAHPAVSGRISIPPSTSTGPAGSSATSGPSAAPSPAAPRKSSATSSPSACWACPETEGSTVYIDYEVSDRIATITLNRPEAANAQNAELLDELDAAGPAPPRTTMSIGDRVARQRETLLGRPRPAGRRAGARQGHPRVHHPARGQSYLGLHAEVAQRPKPSIAAVQGRCYPAGCCCAGRAT